MAKRNKKEYKERRNEILAAAQQLFMQRGYENTPVERIIDTVDISKGTFYYYFKSKEELLDTLAYERAAEAFEKIDEVIFNNDFNALKRMQLYFESSRTWKLENREMLLPLIKMFYSPANLVLRERMLRKNLEIARPILARLVKQGIEEGMFNTQFPEDIAETLFMLFSNAGSTFAALLIESEENPEALQRIYHKFSVYQDIFERMLGAPEGSLAFADEEYLKKFLGPNNRGGTHVVTRNETGQTGV